MQRALAEKAVTENPNLKIFFQNEEEIVEPWIEAIYSKKPPSVHLFGLGDGSVLHTLTKKYNELEILLKLGKQTLILRREDL